MSDRAGTHVQVPAGTTLPLQVFFDQYIDGIDAFVYVKDCEGNYLFINHKTEQLFGITREDLVRRAYTDFDFFTADYAARIQATDRQVLECGHSIESEEQARTKAPLSLAGRQHDRIFTTLKFPLRDENGTIIGLAGFSHEITQHRLANEQKMRAYEQIHHLETTTSIGFWNWRLDTDTITWSESLYQLYGIEPEAFMGTLDSVLRYIHPGDLAFVHQIIDYLLTQQQPRTFNYRIITPNGTIKHLHATTQLHFSDSGQLVELSGSIHDITELRQTELALWQNQERLAIATDAAHLGLWDWNIVTGDVVFNIQWAEMLGYTLDELAPRYETWENLLHPDDKERVIAELQKHFDGTTEYYQVEFRLREKLGDWHWILASGKLVERDEENQPLRMVGIHVDVHTRKASEVALAEANRSLAQANAELKEMQSQVVQSEKLASIGQLAAGVAHEMNTPVGFVASNFQTLKRYMDKFVELLQLYEKLALDVQSGSQQDRLDTQQAIETLRKQIKINYVLDDIQELFQESTEGLERVTSIIANLKDFSRIDQVEAVDEYNLNQGIQATLVVVRNEIKYDADVECDLGDIPPVRCNAGQINQVLLNIIVNAAHAIKGQDREDRGLIRIRTSTSKDQVTCTITDDGPGITPEHRSKIFDPFFTTKPAGKGTGLGLSVSYDIIVNKHKGKLEVDSKIGQGTTFTFRLPQSPPAPKQDNDNELTASPDTQIQSP